MIPRRHLFRCHPAGAFARGGAAVVLSLAMAAAQTGEVGDLLPDEPSEGDDSGGLFSGGLLPDGSILKNVVLPSYDEHLNLASTVTAGELTIFTREETSAGKKADKTKTATLIDKVKATDLRIRFFHPDRSTKGDIAMSQAVFESRPKLDLLVSDEPVTFVSKDLKVDGSALSFDVKRNRGFLHGPVTAVVRNTDLRTSMNGTPTPRVLAAGAMLMAAVPTLPAQEAAPAPATTAERFERARLSQPELDRVAAESASRFSLHDAAVSSGERQLEELKAESASARTAMNRFIRAAALGTLLAEPAPPAALPDVPRPEALGDSGETVVKSKNGAYFDSQEGLLIFLGDVTVKNPQLELKGASEVKLFLEPEKKEEKTSASGNPAVAPGDAPTPGQLERMRAAKESEMAEELKKAAAADQGAAGARFGDAKRMVATGPAVHIRFDSGKPGDKAVEASAHTVVYDFEKEQILLQGGSPWVFQEGGMRAQALGQGAYILVHTDGDGNLTKVVTHNPGGFEGNVNTSAREKPGQGKPNR